MTENETIAMARYLSQLNSLYGSNGFFSFVINSTRIAPKFPLDLFGDNKWVTCIEQQTTSLEMGSNAASIRVNAFALIGVS